MTQLMDKYPPLSAKMNVLIGWPLLGLTLLFLGASARAEEDRERKIDYAPTRGPAIKHVVKHLPINPDDVNVLSGNLADYEADFSNGFMNHMNLWLNSKKEGESKLEWKLDVPASGSYEVSTIAAGAGTVISMTVNGEKQGEPVTLDPSTHRNWHRHPLGEISLKKGKNTLTLGLNSTKGFQFDTLELIQPSVKEKQLQEALSMRKKPDWFKNAGYGLMFQWTNRATPPQGDIKPWEEKVNDFDLESFLQLVDDSGAAYVMWSITWGNHYLSAPIKSLDDIIKGRTTSRDLLGEMADELAKRDVKLIFYYHYGYDCNHSIDKDWMVASGGYLPDKTEFFKNWVSIVTEIGERYGEKLHGWWYDGGQRYYNCHFDNSYGDQGPLSVSFKELTEASRIGNPERIVAYNSWIKPRLTEYQDFYGGEGARSFSGLDDGSFSSGPKEGLQAHGCFILEKDWGHIKKNTPIPSPRYDINKMVKMMEKALANKYPLSINMEMYEDGSVSPESAALLKELKAAIRK